MIVRIAGYEAPQQGDGRYPRGYARLVWMEADGSRPVRYAPVSEDGRARFVQLPKDTASFNAGEVLDSLPVTGPTGAKDVVLDLTK